MEACCGVFSGLRDVLLALFPSAWPRAGSASTEAHLCTEPLQALGAMGKSKDMDIGMALSATPGGDSC